MKSLADAAKKAALDAAQFITEDVRSSALNHGWDADVSANTSITFTGNEFRVDIHEDYRTQAMNHEYGTETSRPTAVLRKYDNNPADAEAKFLELFYQNLGRKI